MQYLVTAEEMRYYDSYTIEKVGIPAEVLMERASMAAFDRIQEYMSKHPEKPRTVFIMAGMGNNGGDGLALARILAEDDFEVEVWCVGKEEHASVQWRLQRRILVHYPVILSNKPLKNEYTIVVDALFGTGLSREITGSFLEAVEFFDGIRGYKLALDVPSGVDSDTGRIWGKAVGADETVTFGFLKRGLAFYPGCEMAGRVTVADIGIASEAVQNQRPGMFAMEGEPEEMLPARKAWGNKGTFGKVLLIAGNVNMAGAAVLSAKAAYRVGAGMVRVLTAQQNREILQSSVPEALCGTWENLQEGLDWADVIAFGPGMGTGEESYRLLHAVLKESDLPLVIDADGLNLISAGAELRELTAEQGRNGRSIVLTPHVGELARMMAVTVSEIQQDFTTYGRQLSEELQVVTVAKDARTLIFRTGKPICINLSGNSGLATAGSGDVLGGMIAGLLAQGMDAFGAACLGVYFHGKTGDRVAAQIGEHACMAGDLVR
ncbi:MAG: NAD(P)H-hydrate dehydratase [Acetatifactor sp.]